MSTLGGVGGKFLDSEYWFISWDTVAYKFIISCTYLLHSPLRSSCLFIQKLKMTSVLWSDDFSVEIWF